MFKRLWSNLPADPYFPSDLEGLGYFVNKDDEIRLIEDERYRFQYFISKNKRFNERQRYAMNEACEKLVHSRLEKLGMNKVLLPLGTKDVTDPHVPIFVSNDIKGKSRVVVIAGETYQDLGILAHRVLGGPGGVDRGSMVSIVKEIQKQTSSPTDQSPPGIIIANTGQLHYWPEGKRALTLTGWDSAPRQSAVHDSLLIGRENYIPGNENVKEHIKYIFDHVIPYHASPTARLDIIGVGDGADAVEEYLDKACNSNRLKKTINCFAIVGGLHTSWTMQSEALLKFLREKARAWRLSGQPLGTIMSGPDGNPETTVSTANSCPVFSGGEESHAECLLIRCHTDVLGWIQRVALTENFCNPAIDTVACADPKLDEVELDWSKWTEAEKAGDGKPLESEVGAPDSRSDPTVDITMDTDDDSGDERV